MKRLLLLAMLIVTSGCSTTHQCEFRVSGSAKKAMITYMVGSSQSQVTESLPWSHSFQHSDKYQPMSLSAQNQDKDGDVKVEIVVDGKTLKSGSASSEYGVATVAATLNEL